MNRAVPLFLSVFLFFKSISAQDLDACLRLFNDNRLQECIDCIERLVPELPNNTRGIALYYKAECLYNTAALEANRSAAVSRFQTSVNTINQALGQADLQTSEYYQTAMYKRGWCHYRLGELQDNQSSSLEHFTKAYQSFINFSAQAGEVYYTSQYLAGEAKIAQVILKSADFFDHVPGAATLSSLLADLHDAAARFRTAESGSADAALRLSAKIRLLDTEFLKGIVHAGANNVQDAVSSLQAADYAALSTRVPADASPDLREALIYSEAIRQLYLYLLGHDVNALLTFSNSISRLGTNFSAERDFRQGNADQAGNIAEPAFSSLASPGGYYASAATTLPEAHYWRGLIQYILDQDQLALDSFNRFQLEISRDASFRQRKILEKAQLSSFQIRLRMAMALQPNSARVTQLARLINDMQNFNTQNPNLQNEINNLSSWARVGREVALGGDPAELTIRVGRAINGSPNLALLFIKEMMPFAAQVVAQQRLFYLNVIDQLLRFTQAAFPQETIFLRGISQMMRAEIAATDVDRIRNYRDAAATLDGIPNVNPFRGEADYIRARSQFFMGSWRNLNEACNALNQLINERKSLRALYLLAEYCRTAAPPLQAEAVACYRIILQRAQNHPQGRFWVVNAEAGIKQCGGIAPDSRSLEQCGIQIGNVIFPDVLSKDPQSGKPIQYEFLADTKFLQTQKAQEALLQLIAFGLPKRSLYPSQNILRHSWIVKEGIFDRVTAPIDERLGSVTAGLQLYVLDESGNPPSALNVLFDNEPQPALPSGGYNVSSRNVGTAIKISIEAAGCYPKTLEHTFRQPQTDTLYVALTRKHSFINSDKGTMLGSAIRLSNRLDQNILLHPGMETLPIKSPLFQSLAESLYVRDYIRHPDGFYLFVDAGTNRIVRFENEEQSWITGQSFSLVFPQNIRPQSLNSPEGIAADGKGMIYIADWGNHRVLVIKKNGEVAQSIGSFGTNKIAGESAKFIYPTRIAVAEDLQGIDHRGRKVYRDRLLFVADANGVHMIDETGQFLETVVRPSKDLKAGSFYGVGIEGFGNTATLYVVDRDSKQIISYKAR